MAIFLIVLQTLSLAYAHPIDLGTLKFHATEHARRFDLDVSVPIAAELTGLNQARFSQLRDNLAAILFAATFADIDLTPCRWAEPQAKIENARVNFSVTAFCDQTAGPAPIDLSFLSRAPNSFELYVTGDGSAGQSLETTLTSRAHVLELNPAPRHSWGEFIKMGIKHIGVDRAEWWGADGLRWPDGIDHILFVIGLVLSSGGLLGVLKTVTGFTLGHSVTLALATFNVVQVPGRVIEPLIALSIAFVAGERLFFNRFRSHWPLAVVFGLVHGLGFATALSELHLDTSALFKALVGFNVGVEMGQVVIVLITFPILFLLGRSAFGQRFVIPAIAALIFAAGMYWFVTRLNLF